MCGGNACVFVSNFFAQPNGELAENFDFERHFIGAAASSASQSRLMSGELRGARGHHVHVWRHGAIAELYRRKHLQRAGAPPPPAPRRAAVPRLRAHE